MKWVKANSTANAKTVVTQSVSHLHLLPVEDGGTDADLLLVFQWFNLKLGGIVGGKSANLNQSYSSV